MHPSLAALDAPFERTSDAAAADIATRLFGIPEAMLTRLDTDRDDSFRLDSPVGAFVLKIAPPDDDPLVINLQSAALAFAGEATPPLPLQRFLPSIEGEIEPTVDVGGRERVARVLTWLPGRPVFEVRPDAAQLGLLGESLGRLSGALADFRHPAAMREFPWDAAQLPLVRDLLDHLPNAEIAATFDWFDATVAPVLAGLPHQVIHNDFHPGNVLAEPDDPAYVTGIIDFGDVVHSARVVDLAVALSYLHQPGNHTANELAAFVGGFERHVRLDDAERTALPALIAARFAERMLINSWLARDSPDERDAAAANVERNRIVLATLLP